MQTTNPLSLPVFDATGYAPRHEVTDPDHAETLAASMEAEGWQGAPLVVLRDYAQALTGVHRLAAAEQAELETIPGVDAGELLAACGIDLWERRAGLEELELDQVLIGLIAELPAEVRDTYGLDLH